jgi:hypothetical protein
LGRIARISGSVRSDQFWIALNIIGIIIALIALYTCYFHFDHFHYRVCSVYANLGHADAQHILGERLLHGKGVEKDQVILYNFIKTCRSCSKNKNRATNDKRFGYYLAQRTLL